MHHLKHHFKKSSDAGDESSVTSSSLSADQAASEESSRAPRPHDPEKETGKPSRLRRKMDELTSDMSKLVNTVKVTVNPNRGCRTKGLAKKPWLNLASHPRCSLIQLGHLECPATCQSGCTRSLSASAPFFTDRHDEAWEQEVDAKMEAIRDGHRFRSFADERDGNVVKW